MPRNRSGRRSIAQATMEWEPLIRVYESRLWRRSLLWRLLAGISFEQEYRLVAEAARLAPGTCVLDLACGPGIYARRFARAMSDGRVVGLDLSLPKLHYASRKARSERLHDLLFVRGDAGELPFAAARFDFVNCCGALHLFPDVDAVLGEVRRVLAAGGRFTAAAFRRRDGALSARRAELRRRLYGIRSFTPDELAAACERAGLVDARCLHAAGRWLIVTAAAPGAR